MVVPTPEHVVPGTIYGAVPRLPQGQPYIPIPANASDGGAAQTAPTSASASAPAPTAPEPMEWVTGPVSRGLYFPSPQISDAARPAPALPTAAPMEWDTGVVSHGFHWAPVDNDRRHSGWEEVEKGWMRQQQGAEQQQQQPSQRTGPAQSRAGTNNGPPKKDARTMALFPYPHLAVLVPGLESEPDFRMRVKLNSQSASVAVNDGFKKWTTFTEGEWSGRLGCGVVVSGGQDSQDLVYGKTLATQVEATHRLRTADEVPAFIECKTKGFRTGPSDVMRALQDPEKAASVDPRHTQYRVSLSMKTTDERYAEKVNLGLWIGSCLWRGSEVIYDVYRVT